MVRFGNGPFWLWSVLVMVRFGYGPFWLWDETSGSESKDSCT